MKKTLFTGAIILLLLIVAGYLVLSGDNKNAPPEPGYTIPRTVRYGFTIQNTGNTLIKNGIFKTYGPVKKTSFQTCKNITASHTFTIQEDPYGNQMLVFALETIPPYGSAIITITAELLLSENACPVSEKNTDIWLQPAMYIESDNEDIIKTAHSLKSDAPEKTEKKILDRVADHITYSGYAQNPRGALYAFTRKKGDCTEYMYLFTALSRAAGIPSRCISGYIVPQNTILKSTGFHNWSEFYDNDRWQVADPQNRTFMRNSHNYISMRIIAPAAEPSDSQFNRFSVEGQGLTARMN